MDPCSEDLFTETSDGLILCKLINLAEFDTIDSRSVTQSLVQPGVVRETALPPPECAQSSDVTLRVFSPIMLFLFFRQTQRRCSSVSRLFAVNICMMVVMMRV